MERREFLKTVAGLAAMHALPLPALGATRPVWTMGFNGLEQDLPAMTLSLQGAVPADCYGTLYRNGPTLYQRGSQRYEHWFDPDGMVQAFELTAKGISHRGRFVRTRKYQMEEAAGHFLFNGSGTLIKDARPVRNNDDANVANTNVQPLAGELLALWEGGSAQRLDPKTLDTLGTRQWSDELAGMPFSAHPRFDEQGHLWNIGSVSFAQDPVLVLYHIDAAGKLRKHKVHSLDFAGYMHDFVLTPRFLVALNSSAVLGAGPTYVDSMHWQPERASQLLVFDRENFELLHTVEIPATFVFHFGNGWENANNIEFTACAYADSGIVTQRMRRLAQRQPGPLNYEAQLQHYRIDTAQGRAAVSSLGVGMEFPGFDRRSPFSPQTLYGVGAGLGVGLSSAIVAADPRSGVTQRYDYGEGIIVEEPQFVPGAEGGFILHTFLDYAKARSGIAILRANALADGPLARADMDRVLPLGFHGCFLAA